VHTHTATPDAPAILGVRGAHALCQLGPRCNVAFDAVDIEGAEAGLCVESCTAAIASRFNVQKTKACHPGWDNVEAVYREGEGEGGEARWALRGMCIRACVSVCFG
jgi:hypothetical protein